jgi:small subunit ribosomal protein S18
MPRITGKATKGGKGKKGGRPKRRKVCTFCVDKVMILDYKDVTRLRKYITERGKILPSRVTGNCAKHQRALTQAIKLSRDIALMPYVID